MTDGGSLTPNDYASLSKSWLTDKCVERAQIRRLDEQEARDILGINGGRGGHFAGLGFPYFRPGSEKPSEWRVRRDHPDLELQPDGAKKERAKYLGPPGRANRLYFFPDTSPSALTDLALPVIVTEGEKKTAALARLAEHEIETPRFLPIGVAGVWSWRGTVGKEPGPNGERRDVKGALADFDLLTWEDREVFILFDNDVHANPKVRAARQQLARELRQRGARVRFVELPKSDKKIGIDDFLAAQGPDEALKLIESAASDELPEINAADGDLARQSKRAWEALVDANDPPYLFGFGNQLVRVERDDESNVRPVPLTEHRLRYELARAARFIRQPKDPNAKPVPAKPPLDLVRDMLATPEQLLPSLRGITAAPQLRPDGKISRSGYDPVTRVYYAADDGAEIQLDHEPTEANVAAARNFIEHEVLGDFPFTGKPERAHSVALLTLPFVRDLIDGPTPLHLFEKPSPGTGASLLCHALTFPAAGAVVGAMVEGRDDDEWRKRLTAKLRSSASHVLIDNLRGTLNSSALASAITATVWEDRVLGTSDQVRLPVRCAWLANGNNPSLSNEMARRTVRIRLDAKEDRPWLRDNFRHPELRRWVAENRRQICFAALVLAKAWHCAGKPKPKCSTLGMFEDWSRVIGGILEVAGIDGFLGNLDEFYAESDSEGEAIRSFLRAWWEEFESAEVGVAQLYAVATGEGSAVDLGDKTERSQKTRLGKLLRQLKDTRYALGADEAGEPLTLCVAKAGKVHSAAMFKLARVS